MRLWRRDAVWFLAAVLYVGLALLPVTPESEAQPARRPTIGWLSYVSSPTENRWTIRAGASGRRHSIGGVWTPAPNPCP